MAELRAELAVGGFAINRTKGQSMRPLIWQGEHYVVVVPLVGEPAVGDLLLFRRGGLFVLHRLVATQGPGAERVYITRGDNCEEPETVRADELIGRAAEVHRIGGWRPWHALWRRKFTVADAAYRRYCRLWAALWPVRRQYYRLRRRLYSIKAKLKSR